MKICAVCNQEKSCSKRQFGSDILDVCVSCANKRYREQNKLKNQTRDFSDIHELKCSKCTLIKDVSCFSSKQNSPRGFDYWCKECRAKYLRSHRERHIDEAHDYQHQWRSERIAWLRSLKEGVPCVDCGQVLDVICMDYDHVPGRGEKIDSVTRMVLENVPKEKILAEISKCDLVCLLCHNRRTQARFDAALGPGRKYTASLLRNIQVINDFKNHPCVLCGCQYDLCNMQADHIDPASKTKDICQLKSCKLQTLLDELAKCRPICALCHRKKSLKEQLDGHYDIERLAS